MILTYGKYSSVCCCAHVRDVAYSALKQWGAYPWPNEGMPEPTLGLERNSLAV
jgi:hypothetical protein